MIIELAGSILELLSLQNGHLVSEGAQELQIRLDWHKLH
jgi:hypothetical protein